MQREYCQPRESTEVGAVPFLFRSTSFGIGMALLAYGFYLDNRFMRPATTRQEASWLSTYESCDGSGRKLQLS